LDDEQIIRMSLKNKLKQLGLMKFLECGDGVKAVNWAMSQIPDIAILDVAMRAGRHIRAARSEKAEEFHHSLTACYDPDTVKRARENGIPLF